MRNILNIAAVVFATSVATAAVMPAAGPGSSLYATDAYPGFDLTGEIAAPEKKNPRWFQFIYGPEKNSPAEQMAYCKALEAEGDWSDAADEYDALVRKWPYSPEAPVAQERFADILLEHLDSTERAIKEYRYLLDFYPSKCDYAKIAEHLYKACEMWRAEGKRFVFFRFANTVDVRLAYEALVVRAPGASFAPKAMLTIASLREEDEDLENAISVYGNLRNAHHTSKEALEAIFREADARMKLLERKAYNRSRTLDVLAFLRQAVDTASNDERTEKLRQYYQELNTKLEDEDWKSTLFYDSPTRTKKSAINALQKFIVEHPGSSYAEKARERLKELQEVSK